MSAPLLEVEDLRVHFPVRQRQGLVGTSTTLLRAVDGVSFRVGAGETLGIVGESGCGKSTLCRAILRLVGITSGRVNWLGENLAELTPDEMDRRRRDLQVVFQDPLSSLNPRMTVGRIISEPLKVFRPDLDQDGRMAAVADMMTAVGLSPGLVNRYPHQFSGGQCQRIGIARAMILRPQLVLCDEPVSALDVSTQAQIVNLLRQLQRETGTAFIFVSHDLSVVRLMCRRIMVMYLGRVAEIASRDELFQSPRHPYTQALIGAIRRPEPGGGARAGRVVLSGEVPSPMDPPSGCAFHTRCPRATRRCRREVPILQQVSESQMVACHHWNTATPADDPA